MHATYEAAKDFLALIGLISVGASLVVVVVAVISYFRAE
jgi:hypothetical protein